MYNIHIIYLWVQWVHRFDWKLYDIKTKLFLSTHLMVRTANVGI